MVHSIEVSVDGHYFRRDLLWQGYQYSVGALKAFDQVTFKIALEMWSTVSLHDLSSLVTSNQSQICISAVFFGLRDVNKYNKLTITAEIQILSVTKPKLLTPLTIYHPSQIAYLLS